MSASVATCAVVLCVLTVTAFKPRWTLYESNTPTSTEHCPPGSDCFLEQEEDALLAKFRSAPPPSLSIVFITSRPGGYDVLLNSLAGQTNKDFELICVDKYTKERKFSVKRLARKLGINLAVVRPDKQKSKLTGLKSRYGIINAYNTGILETRGRVVTFCNDYTWLPPNFVERTLMFMETHPNAYLAYAQAYFVAPASVFNTSAAKDSHALSTIVPPLTQSPKSMGWEMKIAPDMYPQVPLPEFMPIQHPGWWDGGAYSTHASLLMQLNGIDENLDVGDDCSNNNMQDRSNLLGAESWIDGGTFLEQVEHQKLESEEHEFQRESNAMSTNICRWWYDILPRISRGEYPFFAQNCFNLTHVRLTRDYGKESLEDTLAQFPCYCNSTTTGAPTVRIVYPIHQKEVYLQHTPNVDFKVEIENFEVGRDGKICFILSQCYYTGHGVQHSAREHADICHSSPREVYEGVRDYGLYSLRVMLKTWDDAPVHMCAEDMVNFPVV